MKLHIVLLPWFYNPVLSNDISSSELFFKINIPNPDYFEGIQVILFFTLNDYFNLKIQCDPMR